MISNKLRWYRYVLIAPYIVAFSLTAVAAYHLLGISQAEQLTAGTVTLEVDRQQYAKGQTVRFTLSNQSNQAVAIVNNCPAAPLEVYYWNGSAWERRQASTNEAKCAGEPRSYTIDPGKSASATYRYWDGLFETPGRYRLVAPLVGLNDRPSVEFIVSD